MPPQEPSSRVNQAWMCSTMGRRCWLPLLVLVVTVVTQVGSCARVLSQAEEQVTPPPADSAWTFDTSQSGYTLDGDVEFVGSVTKDQGMQAVDDLRVLASSAVQFTVDQHETLLVTHDGHCFSKRMAPGGAGQAVAVKGLPARAAQFAATVPSSRSRLTPTPRCPMKYCPDGVDTRKLVNDSTVFPFSTVGPLLAVENSKNPFLASVDGCTGTLISAWHVLTAAHCVFDQSSGKFSSGLSFAPGQNGVRNKPFGAVSWKHARILRAYSDVGVALNNYPLTGQQVTYGDLFNWDFALITLDAPINVNRTGFLGIAPPAAVDQTVTILTTGYPGDKPDSTLYTQDCGSATIPYATANITKSNLMFDLCDAYHGQSGSALYDNGFYIRGILTGVMPKGSENLGIYDYVATPETVQVGTALNSFVFGVISGWYQEDAAQQKA